MEYDETRKQAIARLLYTLIDQADDELTLRRLQVLTDEIRALFEDDPLGLGTNFNLWVGLKLDTPTMGKDWGKKLLTDYPDYLGT